MMTPNDELYQQTKRLKSAGAPLEAPFRCLADWISTDYGVQVLNVVYDSATPDNRPRLVVVLETEMDRGKFRDPALGIFSRTIQKRVQQQFASLLSAQRDHRFNLEKVFVTFLAFEPVARVEANERVTEEDLRLLKTKLANGDLWEISRRAESVTFFFHTDEQAKRYEAAGLKSVYEKEYSRLAQRHDEFGYLLKRGVSTSFDSKENFDTHYQGSWYHYYK